MASLIELRLPVMEDDKENRVEGWDETIAPSTPHHHQHWERPSICEHAIAHGTWACGIESGRRTDSEDWVTWRTDFGPHRVCRVASNFDGSIVVVSTDGGTVSLLRGRDGKVLATRRVSSNTQEGHQRPAEVEFVVGSERYGSKDVLQILAPASDTNDVVVDSSPTATMILVSNIDGTRLNDEDMDVVAEAARNMSIDALVLEGAPSMDLESLQGCCVGASSIRFVAGDSDGNVSLHDYSLEEKKSHLVKDRVDAGEKGVFLTKASLKLQPFGTENYFLLACAYSEKSIHICWYDVVHMNMACTHTLPSGNTKKGRRVLAVHPVHSCLKDSAIAVAVASKVDSRDGTIHVIQTAVEETMGLAVLSLPHVVYEVPLQSPSSDHPHSLESLDLAPLDVDLYGAYSFRYGKGFGSDGHACGAFVTGYDHLGGTVIGKIRLLLQQGLYDEADEVVASHSADSAKTDDRFAKFHSSEVVLYRLKSILGSSQVGSEESLEQAKACLRRLTAGAVSGSDVALRYLVEAARSVGTWPSKQRLGSNAPTVAEYSIALSGMIGALSSALESAPPSRTSELKRTKHDLEKHLSAMKCLDSLTASSNSLEDRLNSPFCDARSPSDIFCALVAEGCFSLAELLCKSEWGKDLSPEILTSAVLELGPSCDPKLYAPLLREIVIPRLKAGHEALPLIRYWACRTADAFDEDETTRLGLESSIFLLETVRKSIQELNRQMHTSFSSYNPFVGMRERKSRVSPRTTAALNSSSASTDSGIGWGSSTRGGSGVSVAGIKDEQPNPTVLELSSMKGGAVKSRLGFRAKVVPKRSNLDDDEDSEGSLDVKLLHANQLHLARRLGLSRRLLTLRNYARVGGSEHVAKQLVGLYSSTTSSHDARFADLNSNVRPFCEQANVSFDEALVAYTNGLCDSKQTSAQAIVESASIARCCDSLSTKCTAALTVLRAALLCGQCPSCLSKLSLDAIQWATIDPTVKSELEEASRLLVIDGIVSRYCGKGARQLFRVENSRHSERLLDFVCRHIEAEPVVQDAMNLCDAFAHLSKTDVGTLLLQRAIDAEKPELCAAFVSELFKADGLIACAASENALSYCCDVLDEITRRLGQTSTRMRIEQCKGSYAAVCRNAHIIIETMLSSQDKSSNKDLVLLRAPRRSMESFLGVFKRLSDLQLYHGMYPSVSGLDVPDTALSILRPMTVEVTKAVVDCAADADISCRIANLRRACGLLVGRDSSLFASTWYSIILQICEQTIRETNDGRCIDVLHMCGTFQEIQSEGASNVTLSLMLSLCMRAFLGSTDDSDPLPRMNDVIRVFAVAFGHSLASCPESATEAAVFLGFMAEAAGQVLLRGDGGTGETVEELRAKLLNDALEQNNGPKALSRSNNDIIGQPRVATPNLHPSWYVGDGLLLPPHDALSCSLGFCKELLLNGLKGEQKRVGTRDEALKLHRFLRDRGANAVALRVLVVSNVMVLSSSELLRDAEDWSTENESFSPHGTLKCLSERSLGGSGTGITSETIDSQLAVSYLLSLPVKQAFQIFKASLPTAFAKRDFTRVLTFSNIGIAAGGGHSIQVGWKNQEFFVSQCEKMSSRARWWNILQRFQVEFDPSRFDDKSSLSLDDESAIATETSTTTRGSLAYMASLIPALISNSSRAFGKSNGSRLIATRFAKSFGLDQYLAPQKHIEFLLSSVIEGRTSGRSPKDSINSVNSKQDGCERDVRFDLLACERLAKESLDMISSPMKRSAVLRRCVIALERHKGCSTDYERHSLVLALYHKELSSVVEQDQTIRNLDATPFEDELELIDRRRDVIEILSSFFRGDLKEKRPQFTSFFVPLQVPFRMDSLQVPRQCGILGADSGEFDPLEPLQSFMSDCSDSTAIAALAPLGVPLGLSSAYVHARFLLERFRVNGTAPDFERDIFPVLKRLKSARDQRDLSEWCAARYDDTDAQKLLCVDFSLKSAMKLSGEIEQRIEIEKSKRRHMSENIPLETEEASALEAVKRLSEMKSGLSDKQEVNRILRSGAFGSSDQLFLVREMIDDLTLRLQASFWTSSDPSPEKFVEALLTEASMLAAIESFRSDKTFSIEHFRNMASTVHQACKEISEQYSHVHIGQICRDVSRRWLVHGDEVSRSTTTEDAPATIDSATATSNGMSLSTIDQTDDTMSFVMDLNQLGEVEAVWSDDVGSSSLVRPSEPERVTLQEEPSAFVANGSARELSEFIASRAALRVAFVMSFADGYHSSTSVVQSNEENRSGNLKETSKSSSTSKTRLRLLTRMTGDGPSRKANVMEHARELLRLVFAKDRDTGSPGNPSRSYLSECESTTPSQLGKTLTFAMRYRALRTASILCPQEALELVMHEEGYLNNANGEAICTLQKCAFGSFLAKEIEEMGLPLPHSDLVMLSTMHFPSYSRALWRHHRDRANGRLLLLLLEMSLKSETESDHSLTAALLEEMTRSQLPRTLLGGCESIALSRKNHKSNAVQLLKENPASVLSALHTLGMGILSEIHLQLSKDGETASQDLVIASLPTLRRLQKLVQTFSDIDGGTSNLSEFIEVLFVLLDASRSSGLLKFSNAIAELVFAACTSLSDPNERRERLDKLSSYRSASAVLVETSGRNGGIDTAPVSTVSAKLRTQEESYHLRPLSEAGIGG